MNFCQENPRKPNKTKYISEFSYSIINKELLFIIFGKINSFFVLQISQEIDSLKLIDNLLLMERVHTLTNSIIDESKFVSESTTVLK